MNPGELDREITIESFTTVQDGRGEETEEWSTFAEIWASKRPMSATERFASNGTHSVETANFRVRYLEGVLPTMRIVDEVGRKWRITGIAEYRRKVGLDLTAEIIE